MNQWTEHCFTPVYTRQVFHGIYHGVALFQKWHDRNLIWDPMDYGNVTQIYLPVHGLWHPDIVVLNKWGNGVINNNYDNNNDINYNCSWSSNSDDNDSNDGNHNNDNNDNDNGNDDYDDNDDDDNDNNDDKNSNVPPALHPTILRKFSTPIELNQF